jgi:putative PIN family toxin of toxin-antitoxin system
MDVVLDTNIIVSAAINPKGPPAETVRAWRAHSFTWVTSPALLEELESVLRSARLSRYLAWTGDEIAEFLALVRQVAWVVAPSTRIDAIKRDPADNRVLEAAIEGRVDYIVTGDRHLLNIGSYKDIPIVPPGRFVAIITTALS